MNTSANQIIRDTLLGKILVSRGYKIESINKKIIRVDIGMNECREDAGIRVILEDKSEIFIYKIENIEIN